MQVDSFNPVARIFAVMLFTTPLMLSVDIASASVALFFTVCAIPVFRLRVREVARKSMPIFVLTPISGLSMLLYGRPEGREYFSFLAAHVTDNSVQLAMAIMLRVLAIAIPVIMLLGSLDPTEVGDALTQNVKLPQRFVIAAVAGGRLVSLFRHDWDTMRRSRRVRGMEEHGKIRLYASLSFGLLVLALRRGAKLAMAMEARGFGAYPKRTYARISQWNRRDTVLLIGCSIASLCAIGVAMWLGLYRFLGA